MKSQLENSATWASKPGVGGDYAMQISFSVTPSNNKYNMQAETIRDPAVGLFVALIAAKFKGVCLRFSGGSHMSIDFRFLNFIYTPLGT